MRKVSYKFPMQITMSEEVHNKIEKAITGIKFSRYSEQTSEEEISKRRIGDIYLNDIYSIIKRISHMYTMQIKLYQQLKDVLEKERLLTRTPLEEGQVINMIDELRKNIALIRNERNIEANVSYKDKVSKETYEKLQQRFQQLNQKYLKTIKQMEYLKAKDESIRKNTSNEGTKRLIIHKDPIQEMYHKMADFQNWSKATIGNQSTSQTQNVDKDIERLRVEEMDQLRNNLESQNKAYTDLQGKYDQMELMHKQKLQKLRHELSKEKQSLKNKEFEIKRLIFQQQTLQESNQQLKQELKLEKQQSELLRRNDRKNRRNFSSILAIQSQIEQKNKEIYYSLSKAQQEKYKLIESTIKLKGQSQLLSERYFSLLGEPLQE